METTPCNTLTPANNTFAPDLGPVAVCPGPLSPGGSGKGTEEGNGGKEGRVSDDVTTLKIALFVTPYPGPGALHPGSHPPGGSGKGTDGDVVTRDVTTADSDCQATVIACDAACQTDEPFLSHLTTLEVIPTLTHRQITRELKYFKSLQPGLKPRGRGIIHLQGRLLMIV